jgi:serine/threonine protein kinase
MAELPERIGPYRVLSVVGEGGMGVVYKAEDPRLERVVALKVIREFAGDDSRRRRFWQEARAAAQVAHPNACRIYDIAEEQDRLVLVMEFIEGESLARRALLEGNRQESLAACDELRKATFPRPGRNLLFGEATQLHGRGNFSTGHVISGNRQRFFLPSGDGA